MSNNEKKSFAEFSVAEWTEWFKKKYGDSDEGRLRALSDMVYILGGLKKEKEEKEEEETK